MKKILIALTIVISCLGISRVKAEDLQVTIDTSYDEYKSFIGTDNINFIINDVLEEYKKTYMSSYPYFYIDIYFTSSSSSESLQTLDFTINLIYFNEYPSFFWNVAVSVYTQSMGLLPNNYSGVVSRKYPVIIDNQNVFDNSYTVANYHYTSVISLINSSSNSYKYYPYHYYISNFDLYMPPLNGSNSIVKNYDNILIPKLDGSNLSSVVSLKSTDYLIEPYYLYDTDVNINIPNITEINLNDYAYVALALKDYNQEPFSTQVQVKGQYCLTPVYNYGMTERKDILSGSQVERCSPYYNTYTPVRTYITNSDLNNNSIYYLKSYDTTKDNYVKVDTSVFDITYITEENKDNPYVTIGGKTYPTIPYDNLTDTAIKSEDEGYVSGAVEEFSFADIFTAPLEFLKDIWSSIVSVFDLVKEFFSLLPEPIPTFLLSSFLLGLAIGLLKLIF